MSPLFSLFKSSGKTFVDLLNAVKMIDPAEAPTTPEAMAMWLRRGSDKSVYMEALAYVCHVDIYIVKQKARETRQMLREQKAARELLSA